MSTQTIIARGNTVPLMCHPQVPSSIIENVSFYKRYFTLNHQILWLLRTRVTPQMRAVYNMVDDIICTDYGLFGINYEYYCDAIRNILNGAYGKSIMAAFIRGTIDRCIDATKNLVKCCDDVAKKLYIAREENAMYTKLHGRMIYESWYMCYPEIRYRMLLNHVANYMMEYCPNYYWFKKEFYTAPHISISQTCTSQYKKWRIKLNEENNK